ncbi:MAG: nitrogen regulation protein NR(I) [Gammaproteobacteria bacterium]|nr:nitrogen regulation protein NR(I) [Gammaproteobacteria bacterium]MCP4090902.1 nitrogen regulation protein NR(I) [Gammaproteobacteria bacterium]MCP4275189.1 nitrogen regulation protein NR(I) [Gammaproteobacteria bacterium]MCP4830801.1 nitrogen regulation protein NR(I) [Gammaproteobacteria bacterium]MCP4929590.1 nitrogen regulation protein NR(I) [Gammaproteobacteria bacterium]
MHTKKAINVWVVDDDDSVRWVLEKALTGAAMHVRGFSAPSDALNNLEDLEHDKPDVLITDIRMPGMDGLEFARKIESLDASLPIIVITAHTDLDSAVAAYQSGAFEYLPKPFDIDEAVSLVRRAARTNGAEATEVTARDTTLSGMVGQAPAMQEVFRTIGRLSRSSMTVLITGESGTGKELIARALHENSPRVQQAFIALNTTAIAAELLESELFGHERGAFTGAERRHIGRFEQADGGTLFLDEIGDMSVDLQTRLLRVLAEGEFFRVGGQDAIKVDVRIVAATNQDLNKAVTEGRFREDLFHRLNVMHIAAPPLRDRTEDIPALLQHYLTAASEELGVVSKELAPDALKLLQRFNWPGNVRQLINVARRLTVTAPGNEIRVDDVQEEFGGLLNNDDHNCEWPVTLGLWAATTLESNNAVPLLELAQPEFEKALISAALNHACGRKQEAAKLLGWGRNTLSRKLKELGIEG